MAYPLRMAVPPWPSLRCARKRPPTRPKLPIVAVSSIFLIILPITTCRQKRSLAGHGRKHREDDRFRASLSFDQAVLAIRAAPN